MQKKLLIFETTHIENLSSLLVLGDEYFSEVTIFIPASAAQQLKHILHPLDLSVKVNWVTQNGEKNRPFIKRFFRHLLESSYTHLHIGTLEHNVFLFAWYLRKFSHIEISLTLHSVNDYSTGIYTGIRNISETVAKQILYHSNIRYRVLAPAMADTFKNKFPGKQVCFIPGNFYRAVDVPVNPEPAFSVVIPGSVEQKRRDYGTVVRFLRLHAQTLMAIAPFHITLAGNAGSPYGTQITQAIAQLSVQYGFGFSFYTQSLEQSEYEIIYRQADIIWAPVNLHTRSLRDIAEINGITHSPGFLTDQIYFGKPAIIPSGFSLPHQLKDYNWEYEDQNDLLSIFTAILSEKTILKEATQKIKIACQYFKAENFSAAFTLLFNAG